MKQSIETAAFCNGCEFRGSVPTEEPLVYFVPVAEDGDVFYLYTADKELRLSKGIVNLERPKDHTNGEMVKMNIRSCRELINARLEKLVLLELNLSMNRS